MKNSDMPAIPCEVVEQYHTNPAIAPDGSSMPTLRERKVMSGGMTKREMMAMHIIGEMLSCENFNPPRDEAVKLAVGMTDALLAELERTK